MEGILELYNFIDSNEDLKKINELILYSKIINKRQ